MRETPGGTVAEDVRRRILRMLAAGELRVGDRLGAERELARRFGVSRSTLRSALLPLSRAGMLERRTGQGGGTFVRSAAIDREVGESLGLPVRLGRGGHTASSVVLSAEVRPGLPAEVTALCVPAGTEMVVVRRVRYADGLPVSLESVSLVARLVPGILDAELAGSVYQLLAERYRLVPSVVEETVEVIFAQPLEARRLDIAERAPLLQITRVSYDETGVAYEYSEDLFRADRVRLHGRRSCAAEDGSTVLTRSILDRDGRERRSEPAGAAHTRHDETGQRPGRPGSWLP